MGTSIVPQKHAVDWLRNAWTWNPFGIRVGAIHPGMVQTEFSEVRLKEILTGLQCIQGFGPYKLWEDIADIIHFVYPDLTMLILPILQHEYSSGFSTIVKRELFY
jgi:NAD(P)-dependent dehydrogenase (short-subunit alcohol dehydrogenase family)